MSRGGGGGAPSLRLAVVKLGGSVVTDKRRAFTPNFKALNAVAKEVVRALQQGWRFVVVVGGGSYGHVVAAEYRKTGGYDAEMVSATTMAMLELALLVSDIFSLYGLKPVVMPPHAFCDPDPHGIKPRCRWDLVSRLLHYGCTPVLFGDACVAEGGATIVSGDELALEAACSLGAEIVVYVTSVGGVLDSSGKIIPTISLSEVERVSVKSAEKYVDVTGGMRHKLEAIKALACSGLVVAIIGLEEGSLVAALEGRVKGTLLRL